MQDVVLGIDIGGTGIKFGLVTRTGEILVTDKVKTKGYPNPEKLPEDLLKWATKACSDHQVTLVGVGIGTPNGNYYKGTIDFAPNLPWKGVVTLKSFFESTFKLPAALTNDAKAAAIGEMYFGGAKGMKDFLFITLGTGLGSGIVVNGQIAYGFDSLAGEVGHTIVYRNGRECPCGRRGCLEQYVSAPGIVKTYYELLRSKNLDEFRTSIGNMIDSAELCKLAEDGDTLALEAFQKTGEILGFALSNSACYTRPEKIFLFGGLAQAGDLIFKPTIKSFESYLLPIYQNKIPIVPSGLKESEAAILGSASLIWNELNK
ncbi:MAG TPA: ROK family protein [Chitinophagales bacterium]|nr:ROK family protein [Chitinophagales bacterium]HMZ88784.1 ROK family protein [Chitinophagales bacterium]HNA57855.1 ROK family protein [Chitinophagales bacterium]HNE46510.1 ROK family protein [Chitinophagales bacterium]HNF68530.1 ROK family protein [Chitinophagales bacterium]